MRETGAIARKPRRDVISETSFLALEVVEDLATPASVSRRAGSVIRVDLAVFVAAGDSTTASACSSRATVSRRGPRALASWRGAPSRRVTGASALERRRSFAMHARTHVRRRGVCPRGQQRVVRGTRLQRRTTARRREYVVISTHRDAHVDASSRRECATSSPARARCDCAQRRTRRHASSFASSSGASRGGKRERESSSHIATFSPKRTSPAGVRRSGSAPPRCGACCRPSGRVVQESASSESARFLSNPTTSTRSERPRAT
jgi:hypothetical protein